MLPMLTREVVEKHGWITEEELLDYYAIGQCTPGIIAVNTATFVGFKENGVTGAAFSTTGIVAPSYIIITLIASLLSRYMDAPVIAHALAGIRIMVSAILLNMVFNLVRKNVRSVFGVLLYLSGVVMVFFTSVPTVVVVLSAAVIGIVFNSIKEAKK